MSADTNSQFQMVQERGWQRVLVGEKRSGTAAWVLSKPVTRTAFVVSRLVVNSIAILLTSVVAPGVIVYFTLSALSDIGWLSPVGFLGAIVMVALHHPSDGGLLLATQAPHPHSEFKDITIHICRCFTKVREPFPHRKQVLT